MPTAGWVAPDRGLSGRVFRAPVPEDRGQFRPGTSSDSLSRSIVDAINRIGHVLGISTIAEFVENAEIAAELQKLGVDYVQGLGVHKPEPLSRLLSGMQPPKFAVSG